MLSFGLSSFLSSMLHAAPPPTLSLSFSLTAKFGCNFQQNNNIALAILVNRTERKYVPIYSIKISLSMQVNVYMRKWINKLVGAGFQAVILLEDKS